LLKLRAAHQLSNLQTYSSHGTQYNELPTKKISIRSSRLTNWEQQEHHHHHQARKDFPQRR
jgi:hypothetical protein